MCKLFRRSLFKTLTSVDMRRILMFVLFLCPLALKGQAPQQPTSSEIITEIKKFSNPGAVLYLAAHPDDENTRFISWMSNGQHIRTAYLSLTRGDGGQNLIGPELNEKLGVIRTQELLAARRIDKGEQFFARAIDFGYSKTAEESMAIWDSVATLSDVVYVIRKFHPDLIVTRFSPESGPTHGHHTASAQLAMTAFDLAGDSTAFPEQLDHVKPWQPNSLYWNTSSWFFKDNPDTLENMGAIKIDVNGYSPELGASYPEIAAESRSSHKSQGFGIEKTRDELPEYFYHLKGKEAEESLMELINQSWGNIPGGAAIETEINNIIDNFRYDQPAASIQSLIKVDRMLSHLDDHFLQARKRTALQQIIKDCLGLYIESSTDQHTATPGENIKLNIELTNRSDIGVIADRISFHGLRSDTVLLQELPKGKAQTFTTSFTVPESVDYTHPYWLKRPAKKGIYDVPKQEHRGKPELEAPLQAYYDIVIDGHVMTFSSPIVYKTTDPVKAEVYRPFEITPPATIALDGHTLIFPDQQSKTIDVTVTGKKDRINGKLSLKLPEGWSYKVKDPAFSFDKKGQAKRFSVTITPPEKASEGSIDFDLLIDGKSYNRESVAIDYRHIPYQVLFPEASVSVVKVNLRRKGKKIGYINGTGDAIPGSMRQIGYTVDELAEDKLGSMDLSSYDAIILGIRAFNASDQLPHHTNELFEYVRNGGNLIVQYNTSHHLKTEDISPYPLTLSHDRVTKEDAPVTLLSPKHPILNTPHKITAKDFEGWVQERGLYFANDWDKDHFTPVLSCKDPGESHKEGGLLVAQHGKGYYIYTGYSWFRQLPAGVPGAYRLFTNMVSLGK